jgi:hypothetical protein
MATAPTLIRTGAAIVIAAIAFNTTTASGIATADDGGITAGAAVVTPTPVNVEVQADPNPTKNEPTQSVHIAYPEDEAIYEWAVGLFQDADLALPDFIAEFHTTPDPCKGYMGLHVRTNVSTTIHICATDDNEMLRDGWRRRTLLHEMAHAWTDQYVSEEAIAEFMARRGVSEWSSEAVPWADRGAEHAAEAVMASLQDELLPHILMKDKSEEAMQAAFAILVDGTS